MIDLEFIRNGEEAMERCQKQEIEYEALKEQCLMIQDGQTSEEGRKFQEKKIRELQNEVVNLKQIVSNSKKTIGQLEENIKQKDKIMIEYDERFDLMEERTQDVKGMSEVHLLKLQKEIEALRKENEELLLNKQKEANALMQERINNKKSLMILEKNIDCLFNEKAILENKLKNERMEIEKTSRRCISREVQTDNIKINEGNSTQLIRREQEIDNIQRYANSLKNDRDQAIEKLANANKKIEELKITLDERIIEVKKLQSENNLLKFENMDMKKRREAAITEIKKLNQQLKKKGGEDTGFRQKKRVDPKIPRHISEAVI